MALNKPTPTEFKARYPEFAPVGDPLCQLIIDEAAGYMDEDWTEADQKPAMMALTAHLLSIQGYPGRLAEGGGFDPGLSHRSMKSRTVGDVSVTFGGGDSSGGSGYGGLMSTLQTTVYGQTFAHYMQVNVPTFGLV